MLLRTYVAHASSGASICRVAGLVKNRRTRRPLARDSQLVDRAPPASEVAKRQQGRDIRLGVLNSLTPYGCGNSDGAFRGLIRSIP